MAPYLQDKFGNAASRSHAYGWVAEEAVDYAREQVAKLIGAKSKSSGLLVRRNQQHGDQRVADVRYDRR